MTQEQPKRGIDYLIELTHRLLVGDYMHIEHDLFTFDGRFTESELRLILVLHDILKDENSSLNSIHMRRIVITEEAIPHASDH